MHIWCNTGVNAANWHGHLSGYGSVWYFPDGIANILSLSHAKKKYGETFDSAPDNSFHAHKEGKILKFQEGTRRFYFFDTAEQHEDSDMFITTVEENKSNFLVYDVSRAKLAH